MENASKALLMAASVLIGILILSLAVYLFVSFGTTSAEIHKQNQEQQLAQFNSQFMVYEGKQCTIYDVVTVANLATENNKYYEFTKRNSENQIEGQPDNYIAVRLIDQNSSDTEWDNTYIEGANETPKDYNALIRKKLEEIKEYKESEGGEEESTTEVLPQYQCEVAINETTKRVYKITFTKTP